ncbi:MAG TPA: hypothetical protein VHF23_04900, partial [Gaiellaceae bacterium]|nr:hypothetical protein [Gaiellaceae bacterium]
MSPPLRTRVLVALAAVVSAALVVGVTVLQTENGTAGEPPPAGEAPPLELGLLARDDAEARALREAEAALERGERDRARSEFEAILA